MAREVRPVWSEFRKDRGGRLVLTAAGVVHLLHSGAILAAEAAEAALLARPGFIMYNARMVPLAIFWIREYVAYPQMRRREQRRAVDVQRQAKKKPPRPLRV